MQAFLRATDVFLTVLLQDHSGNPLSVASVEARITNGEDVVIVERYLLADFVATSHEVTVKVDAVNNELAIGQTRGVRGVDLFLTTTDGNTVAWHTGYVLMGANPLQTGVNSFQSYLSAQALTLDVPNLIGFVEASEQERTAALIEAHDRISGLSFSVLNRRGQEYLEYAEEGVRDVGSNLFGFAGDIREVSPAQFMTLLPEFRQALAKAQLVEADVILGGDPIEAKRQQGLILDSIGESRQMFRRGTPLNLQVSRRALAYLSRFIITSKRLGRI